MSEYYRRDGTPYSDVLEWAKDFGKGHLRRVAETTVPDGRWVSTVWLGLDHQYGKGLPLIFETMVFTSSKYTMKTLFEEKYCERYSTEAEALAGHERIVSKLKAGAPL